MVEQWNVLVLMGVILSTWISSRPARGGNVRQITWRTLVLLVVTPCVLGAWGRGQRISQPPHRVTSARPDTTHVESGSMFIVAGDTLTAISKVGRMRILVRGDSAWQLEPGPKIRLTGAMEALYVKFVENKRNAADFKKRYNTP